MKLSAEKEAELGVQLLMPLGLQNPPRIKDITASTGILIVSWVEMRVTTRLSAVDRQL